MSREVTPERGGSLELDGVQLEVPAGAVDKPVTISITSLPMTWQLSDGMMNVTSGAMGYRFEPHGMQFAREVFVSMPFDKAFLGSETALSNLFTYFYSDKEWRWERLRRVCLDRDAATVTSGTNHFTDMINATLKLPEGPSPAQFDVNSIKNLEAANPSLGVPMPRGLEPGPFGSASFSLDLRLPKGRGGATPSLTLFYSNEMQNGWMGKGFGISVPSVSIDTRFGLPGYDGADTYLLEGEELVFAGNEGGALRFRPLKEASFSRILWRRGDGEDYWEVTGKSGDVKEYGRGEGWIGPARADRSHTYIWYLTESRDPFGNTVEYHYTYDAANAFTYLSEIVYSGHEGTGLAGAYRIAFTLEDRQDRRIDSRGKFPSKLARRLSRVDEYYSGALIRSYLFTYLYNQFGQSQLASFSETDAVGNVYYMYSFDYYALAEHAEGGTVTGYDGFEDEQYWSVPVGAGPDTLTNGSSSSAGGNLYAGLQIWFWLPFVGTQILAEIGIRGGFDISRSMTTTTFQDINGDGLPDIAWKNGNTLQALLNQSGSFGSVFSLPGLSGKMEEESGTTVSIGGSVGLLGASGALTYQYTTSEAATTFTDVNGDGFLDYITKGSSQYGLNSGAALVSTAWAMDAGSGGAASPDPNEEKYKSVYYREEPLRKWRAYRSGTVEITQDAALLNTGSASQDGVRLYTYPPEESQSQPPLSLSRAVSSASGAGAYTLNKDDFLYFRMDAGENELGDETEWRVRISYTSVRLFEDMAYTPEVIPPQSYVGMLPDERLVELYDLHFEGEPPVLTFTLKDGWEDLGEEILEPALAALIDLGTFIPKRLPRADMDAMIAAIGTQTMWVPGAQPPGYYPAKDVLLTGFRYVKETQTFYRVDGRGDGVLSAYFTVLPVEERRRLAYYPWLDGTSVLPRESSGVYSRESARDSGVPAQLLRDRSDAVAGETVWQKGILLDRMWEEGGTAYDSMWLRPDGGGWRLFAEASGGGEAELTDFTLTTDAEAGTLAVTVRHQGVLRTITVSGSTSMIERLAEEAYGGPLSDYILRNHVFSTYGFERIPVASWNAIYAAVGNADKATLDACFELDSAENQYVPREGVTQPVLQAALLILNGYTERGQSALDLFPNDPDNAERFVVLNPFEYDALVTWDPGLASYFVSFSSSGVTYRYQRPDLTDLERVSLHDAMAAFRRDVELFPYYTRDAGSGIRTLSAAEEDLPIVENTLAAAGLTVWTAVTRSILYSSADVFSVEAGDLPDGASVEQDSPRGSLTQNPDAQVGIVKIPVIGADGRTRNVERYLHIYDSASDYSPQNLVSTDIPYAAANGENEVFGGGVWGWYCGVWVGNNEWDESLLSAAPPTDSPQETTPYFFAMSPNTDGGEEAITTDGRGVGIPVPATAWVGRVSGYSEPVMDDSGATVTENYTFAAFISADMLHASRNGGDAYYRIPRSGGSTAGGTLPYVRMSHSDSLDTNIGAGMGGIGGSFSSNNGSSWQYQGLMDLNGDRYPDLIEFDSGSGGSTSFTMTPGTGRGFGTPETWTTPFAQLSRMQNSVLGLGASLGSSSGAISVGYDDNGKPESATTKQPTATSMVSAGVNGTLGSSYQNEGFYDVNGDGLPDHVRRSGTGDYQVALNMGSGAFAAAADWGSGVSTPSNLFDGFGGLTSQPSGLAHTSTGSFGASLGFSVDGGVVGVGISAGYTGTVNQTFSSLADMNGDGLPDQVVKINGEDFFRVKFNLGDCFSSAETRIYRPDWGGFDPAALRAAVEGDLDTIASNLTGLSLPEGTSVPGFTGLPTSGNGFSSAMDPLRVDDVLDYSSGASFNLGATLTVRITFPLVALTFTGGANGSWASTSSTVKFMDVDGDGLPDHVMKLPYESFLRVKLNGSGRAGLLRTVHLPMGGRYDIEYDRVGNTVDMPVSRWVMSRVTRSDGVTAADRGEHSYGTSFNCVDGYYDRAEREFWGFSEVQSLYADGSRLSVWYYNRDNHTKGMERRRLITRQDGAPLNEKITTIQEQSEGTFGGKEVVYPEITVQTQRQYDDSGSFTEAITRYGYEPEYGNIVSIRDEGDPVDAADDLVAWITYDEELSGYFKQHPGRIRVEDSHGTLLRLREGEYGDCGELVRLTQYESAAVGRTWNIGYDAYGNLGSVRDPRGSTVSWDYDGQMHAFAVTTRSSNPFLGEPQYESRATWDYRWGTESTRTDMSGELMRYTYDGFGRLTEIWSPYDTGAIPCVRYDYSLWSFPWSAVTYNKVSYDPADDRTLRTVISIDGLDRALQTAKQGEVRRGASRLEGWNLSGAVAYDGKGRRTAEGQSVFAEGAGLPGLADMRNPTLRTYDSMDRILTVTLADNSVTSTAYLVRNGSKVERVTDPKGNISERVLDARRDTLEVRSLDDEGLPLAGARYTYNPMGEILTVTDSEGNTISSVYDMLGRRTRFESPDSGIVSYEYDASGNRVRKVDSVMRAKGQAILYTYDGLNRLVGVDYPKSTDVSYTYGAPGAPYGGAGRIVQRADGSGTTRYRYGRLGETTRIERTIKRLTPLTPSESAVMGYQYDYLGRMQTITYPDGETVSYSYDYGGQVRSVTGTHYGAVTTYVQDIGYDEFGQRVYIRYGNGVETRYGYDEARRWLDTIRTEGGLDVYQDMSYCFDAVGNILSVANNATRYQTEVSYAYDALYQLTSVSGQVTSMPHGYTEYVSIYAQDFTFDSIGNLTRKTSTETTSPQADIGAALNYVLDYQLYAGKAHQPERIGQLWYLYDANGNMIEERQGGHSETPQEDLELESEGDLRTVNKGFGLARYASDDMYSFYLRTFRWDEENRLTRSVDGDAAVDYRYGSDGQRAVKYSDSGETLYFDSMWQMTTDYPDMRQSKHIYVGQTRIATRCNIKGQTDVGYEEVNTFYYHGDHLGSAQLVTDYSGEPYEHTEYTPYGEMWVEDASETVSKTPFRFTGKEFDEETGLYYYGARYLNPKTSIWISADPAMEKYLPVAPVNDEARARNANLPGMGGVFNTVNLSTYAYAGNNPVKLIDPDGQDAAAAMVVLTFAAGDAVIPEPTDVVAPIKIIVYGLAALFALAVVNTTVETQTQTQTRRTTVNMHHIATDKNSASDARGGPWTPRFAALFALGGLSLNIPENQVPVENHAGPHPQEYHEFVYATLSSAVAAATTGLTEGTEEYKQKAAMAIKAALATLALNCQTPGTPLNLMITRGVPGPDEP